jgi:hypothetical protein
LFTFLYTLMQIQYSIHHLQMYPQLELLILFHLLFVLSLILVIMNLQYLLFLINYHLHHHAQSKNFHDFEESFFFKNKFRIKNTKNILQYSLVVYYVNKPNLHLRLKRTFVKFLQFKMSHINPRVTFTYFKKIK